MQYNLLMMQLVPSHQSGGGVCREAGQSYKATVIHAAKVTELVWLKGSGHYW